MKLIDQGTTTRTSETFVIEDEELDVKWFICFEFLNGKFKKAREMMNYEYFQRQGGEYMQKVYELAAEQLKGKYNM